MCIRDRLFVAGCTPLIDRGVKKPVIYFYPQETTEVDIKLTLDGEFIATYPKYNDGWKIVCLLYTSNASIYRNKNTWKVQFSM